MVGLAQACDSVVAEMGFGPDGRESGHHRIGLGLPYPLLSLSYFFLAGQAFDEQTGNRGQGEFLVDVSLRLGEASQPLHHQLASAIVRHPEPLAYGQRIIWEHIGFQIHWNVPRRIPVFYPSKCEKRKQRCESRMKDNDFVKDTACLERRATIIEANNAIAST